MPFWNTLNTTNRWTPERPSQTYNGISNAGYGNIVPLANGRYGYDNPQDKAKEAAAMAQWYAQQNARVATRPTVQENDPQALAKAWWAANNPTPVVKPITEDPYSQTIRNIRTQYAQAGLTGSQQELNALGQAEMAYQKQYQKVPLSGGGTAQEDYVAQALNETIRKIRERYAQLGRSGSSEEYRAIQDAAIQAAATRASASKIGSYPVKPNNYTGVLGNYATTEFSLGRAGNPFI